MNNENIIKVKKKAGKPKEPVGKQPTTEEAKPKTQPDLDRFVVSVPSEEIDYLTMPKLEALICSKEKLLMKALNTDNLKLEQEGDKILFPWFTLHGITGEAEAYAQLVTAMIKLARESKGIDSKQKPVENEKFAMRMFTVRLGLKGDEYKLLRKLVTENLSGNSAWKNGTPPKKPKQNDGEQTSQEGGSTL